MTESPRFPAEDKFNYCQSPDIGEPFWHWGNFRRRAGESVRRGKLMERYTKESRIAAPVDVVFRWHEAPDAFEKLTPPWESLRIVERSAPGIQSGTKITLEIRLGPLKRRWVAVHTDYRAGRMFRDEQLSGPFSAWAHTHVVEPRGPHHCLLI